MSFRLILIMMNIYSKSPSIKCWAEDDRPREKLILKGKSALSDAELIAILLRSGNRQETAVDLAKRILNTAQDNLIELSKLCVADLQKFHGMGEAKSLSVIAALELGRRRRGAEILQKQKITHSRDAFVFFHSMMEDLKFETFWILLLNRANKIIKPIQISEGGITGTIADPKKIFKIALENSATGIILCHNHPSGNIQPSEADKKLTKKLINAGNFLDIVILDHVIVGEESYFSFADEGVL